MIIQLSKENEFQAIEYIKKYHRPENVSFIDIDLVDGLFRKINNKLYENNEFPPSIMMSQPFQAMQVIDMLDGCYRHQANCKV